jgi:hypothetical protein
MSVALEMLHESLPVATGINPLFILPAIGGLCATGYGIKRVTNHWHQTINRGEIGIPLRSGEPILLDRYTQEDVDKYEQALSDGIDVEIASHYVQLRPAFYWIKPYHTIQPVYTGDVGTHLLFPFESHGSDDQSDDEQLTIHANMAWHIMEEGDSPIYSFTRVKTEKTTKKDKPEVLAEKHIDELGKVLGYIGSAALGEALGGKTAAELKHIKPDMRENIQQQAARAINVDAARYGAKVSWLKLLPIVRTGEEVLAQALKQSITAEQLKNVALFTRKLLKEDITEHDDIPITAEPVPVAA